MEIRRPVSEQIFGSNKAPLAEVLKNDFADLAVEVEALVAVLKAGPKVVKSTDHFSSIGALSNAASTLIARLEAVRKAETDPMFRAQKDIKAHFDLMADAIGLALTPLTRAANDYTRAELVRLQQERDEKARKLREQEKALRVKAEGEGATAATAAGKAEALSVRAEELETALKPGDVLSTCISGGGTASASSKWTYEITDYDSIDLEKLRPFLSREAVEVALRSVVRIQKGNTSITGVRVFETVQANFKK